MKRLHARFAARRLSVAPGILALLLAAAIAAPGRCAAQDCPAAFVWLTNVLGPPFSTTGAAYDSTYVSGGCVAHVGFDRAQGTLWLDAHSGARLAAAVRVVEAFDVTGVAPGTVVSGVIALELDGRSQQNCGGSGCGIQVEGRLVAGADSVGADANQIGPSLWTRALSTTLTLPVVFVAGSPVHAEFAVIYGTGPGASGAMGLLSGRYRVTGLPDGVHAVTCSAGYTTPAQRPTWGALKSRYH
jgi:hypothetical protein